MPFGEVVKVFAIILVPVAIGMLVRSRNAAFATRMDRPVRALSAVVLAVLVLGILIDERENVGGYLADVGLIATAFCAISLVVGYVVPKAVGVVEGQAIASSMEIGVHNGTLAIFIAARGARGGDDLDPRRGLLAADVPARRDLGHVRVAARTPSGRRLEPTADCPLTGFRDGR